MTGVPATGLPKITRVVSRSCRPTCRASPLWSMTAKTFRPLADKMPVSRETVALTDRGLTFVVTWVCVLSGIAGAIG
jgi:hypothetical protein